MPKSKRKAIRDLAQSKVVDIANYRSLSRGREAQQLALISSDQAMISELKKLLEPNRELQVFDGRFSLEQAVKSTDFDAVIIDERLLQDEALQLCEKLKRQSQLEELVILILSESSDKERVRESLEKGCDEWVSRLDDLPGFVKLVDHYLS